jgi:hypothetical protein
VTRQALVAMALVALCLPAAAQADPPTRVTIGAVFDPITYGEDAYVNGQLIGEAQGGQPVALEQSAPPFTDWTAVAQVVADAAGYYTFKLHPSQTLQYRTSSQSVPSEKVAQVSVAPRVKLAAAAAGKTSVRFSGRFAPALAGQSVAIQRRSSSGAWTTVANARLQDGKTFNGRLRAHTPVMLRAVFATDGAHLDAFSNSVRAVPGAVQASAAAAGCVAPRITRPAFTPDPGPYSRTARVYAISNGCRSTAVRTLGPTVAAPQ